ncbi:unnamed protein product [Prunus armeniaca]
MVQALVPILHPVQAVLLLLGGRDISSSFPSSESLLESNSGATSHKIQNFHEELHLLLSSVKNGKRDALKRKFDTLVEKRLLREMVLQNYGWNNTAVNPSSSIS